MYDTYPFDEAAQSLGTKLFAVLSSLDEQTKAYTQEIRLRCECKITLRVKGELKTLEHIPKITSDELKEAFESMCGYSVYAHQQEIASGYITIRGGHRAGVCGTAVTTNGQVTMLRDITAINLRIARACIGCSAQLFSSAGAAAAEGGILIAGAPMSGKTTLLRDIAASLSKGLTGRRYAVSLLDERGELAACHNGIPQYECVRSCDVLSGYPKGDAITAAIRSMAPQIIVCDEISSEKEACAVSEGFNAGVGIIASVHAENENELLRRPAVKQLIDTGAFKLAVLLSRSPLNIEKVIKTEDLRSENDSMCSDNAGFGCDGMELSGRYKTQIRVA